MIDSIKEEKRTELLIKIVSQKKSTLDDQLYYALQSTCELLDLEIGIISNIYESTYTVEHFFPVGAELYKGQTFELGNTYCSITLDSEGPFEIAHMAESAHNMHPCYNAFHLESYIGIPFEVNGKLYGTINFSGSKPKKGGFSQADLNLITLLGEWAGGIIQRRNIEAELQREKELYKLISTNSADLVCLHKADGTYNFASESSYEITGYNPNTFAGNSPFDFIHPDDIDTHVRPSFERVASGVPVKDIEYRFKREDGEYIWMNTAAEPIISDTGEVTGIQTTSRDVSDRKRIEVLFKESQQMANVGGWEYDLKSGKLYWTEEVYRIHEKELDAELSVEEGLSYFPAEARDTIEQALQHAIETGELYDLELPFISAKNNHKWVRAIGRAEFDNGTAYKLHGTFQDITERKRNRDQISKQNEHLFQEKKTKEKLYSILSHDIRNSLFGISAFLELTMMDIEEDEFDKSKVTEKFRMLLNSSKSSLKLLETIQNWVKMQAGYFTVVPKTFNIVDEIEQVKNLYQAGMSKKNITLSGNFNSEDYIPVFGDPEMIGTIIRNLINNAIKYSQNGGDIELILKKEKEGMLDFIIKDHGIGMSEEIVNRLFKFNNRPQRKGTEDEPGTGLGLMLCKELAAQNNASILVDSKVGEGTIITVRLPVADTTENESELVIN